MPLTIPRPRLNGTRVEHDPDDVRMTLGEHLDELRSRLIKVLIGLLVGAAVCFAFKRRLFQLLLGPTFAVLGRRGLNTELVVLDPLEPFMTTIKTAVIVGFILSAPYGLYQIWAFVAAGLYPRERKVVQRFVPVSIALFLTGALFFLIIVMPVLINFLVGFIEVVPGFDPAGGIFGSWGGASPSANTAAVTSQPAVLPSFPVLNADPPAPADGAIWINSADRQIKLRVDGATAVVPFRHADQQNVIRPNFSLRYTIDFTFQMAASFGVGFQVPVVVALLAALGIVTSAQMASSRRMTWFIMTICSAVFTPSTDPGTMLLLLLPMGILFEAGLFAARRIERKKEHERAAEGY